jgi:hypothetical protein
MGESMIRNHSLLAAAVVVGLVLMHESCLAQMYKWKDENGGIHFSRDLSTIPERDVPRAKVTESKAPQFDHRPDPLPDLRTYMGNLEPEGFRNIQWGQDLPSLKTLGCIEEDPRYGGIEICINVGDDLTIGSATLERVEYRFWRSKFYSARAITEGYSNFLALKEAAFERFGAGYRPNPSIERYFWIGNRTNISLDYDEMVGVGGLFMSSVLMLREMEELDEQMIDP